MPIEIENARRELAVLAKEALAADTCLVPGHAFQEEINGFFFDSIIVDHVLSEYITAQSRAGDRSALVLIDPMTYHGSIWANTAREFIEKFFDQIKKIVCGNSRRSEASKMISGPMAPTAAALGVFILNQFSIHNAMAAGFATFILLVIIEATRGAFCAMTKAEVLENLPGGRRRK